MTAREQLEQVTKEYYEIDLGELHEKAMNIAWKMHNAGDKRYACDIAETIPEGKAWLAALKHLRALECKMQRLEEDIVREENPGPRAYIALVVSEEYDDDEYSSRVSVETTAYGPYATEEAAEEATASFDGVTIIETCNGVPVTSIHNGYGHCE